ncbi:MAG: hypothetical protein P8Y18_03920 [Candidatus Bathyarchaeota archaeon]
MKLKKSRIPQTIIFLLIFQIIFFTVVNPVFKVKSSSLTFPISDTVEKQPIFQKGLSYSAWSSDVFSSLESDESLGLLTETNAEWIAICFSWVQTNRTSYDIHIDPIRTPTTESVKHAIEVAHNLGLKVMLKPMIDTLEEEKIQGYPTVWRGEIQPSNEWFLNYAEFIKNFADFAEKNNVELFCIGCEFKATVQEEEQWGMIISGVREYYSGPITYAADWTNYQNINWWNLLDYVGIDAYFPLSLFNYNPTLDELENTWNNYANEIEEWLSSVNKPVIFTEIGYRSGDGTNIAPANYWLDMSIDLQEQVDCYEAAFQTLWNRNWFYGFYWWTWIFDPTQGGIDDSHHTPQNKPAQDLITQWYSQTRQVIVIDQTFTTTEKCLINQIQTVGFHASWDQNGSDITNAIIEINGTKYTTNSTGWISFNVSYDTAGNRSWVVTDAQHSTTSSFFVSTDTPSIVWDTISVDIEVISESVGVSKVVVKITKEYDQTAIIGVKTYVNGELCEESESGVYVSRLESWNPIQQITVQTDLTELNDKTWTFSSINILNLILFALVIVVIIAIAFVLKKRSKNKSVN